MTTGFRKREGQAAKLRITLKNSAKAADICKGWLMACLCRELRADRWSGWNIPATRAGGGHSPFAG